MTISNSLTFYSYRFSEQSQIHYTHLNRTCLNESEINRRSTFICKHILNPSIKKCFSTGYNGYTTHGHFSTSVSSSFKGYSTFLSNISQKNLYSHTVLSASRITHCVQKRFKGKKPTGETIEAIGKVLEINIPKATTINPNIGVNLAGTDPVSNAPNLVSNSSVEEKKGPTVQAGKTDFGKVAIKKPFIEQPYSDPKTYTVPADKDENKDKKPIEELVKFDFKQKHMSYEESLAFMQRLKEMPYYDLLDIGFQAGLTKHGNTSYGNRTGKEQITKSGHETSKQVKNYTTTTLKEAPSDMEPEYKVVLVKIHENTLILNGMQTHMVCLVKDNIAIGYFTGDKHGTEFIADKKFDNMGSNKEGPHQHMAVFEKPFVIPKDYMYETEETIKATTIINNDPKILNNLEYIRDNLMSKEALIYDGKGITKKDFDNMILLKEDLNHKPVSHNDKNYNKPKSLLDKVLGNVSFKKDNVNNPKGNSNKAKTDKDADDIES